jgi:hypothetical protein
MLARSPIATMRSPSINMPPLSITSPSPRMSLAPSKNVVAL